MVNANMGGLTHMGLGVEGNAHAGGLQHANVIGTITHGERIGGRDGEAGRHFSQGRHLGGATKDGLGHLAGELAIFNDE